MLSAMNVLISSWDSCVNIIRNEAARLSFDLKTLTFKDNYHCCNDLIKIELAFNILHRSSHLIKATNLNIS